jgi:uncharacterized membrane protein
MPLTKLVKEKIKPSHRLKAWEIILLILGSPIWAPLLLTAIVLVIAMAVVILALLLSFYAIVLSMAVAGIGGLLLLHRMFRLPFSCLELHLPESDLRSCSS